jgi:hypothetical protein
MYYYNLSTKFGFGKHKGKTLMEVYKSNPSYIDWCLREINTFRILRDTLNKLIEENDYNFSNESLNSIDDTPDDSIEEIDESEWTGSRPHDDYYYWQLEQHPALKDRSDADILLDEADAIGCDPEDLISNLD